MSNKKSKMEIDQYGTKIWRNEKGQLHREDGPAIERSNGSKFWYINDELHREDGPAREFANGIKEWIINGQFHREDGPAVEYPNGEKYWYINGIKQEEKIVSLALCEQEHLILKPNVLYKFEVHKSCKRCVELNSM